MSKSMWIQDISGSQQAGQRTRHGRMLENATDLRDSRQEVIALVSFLIHGIDLPIDVVVERCWVIGMDGQIS